MHDPDTQPLPEGGWSEDITTLRQAVVVPADQSGFVQAAGVLDAQGAYCAHGALWRKFRPLTTEPAQPENVTEHLPGRWLWGGVLWAHFGHFLVESTARLWALDHLDAPIDGVIFIPKRPKVGDAVRGFQRDFVHLMAPDLPMHIAVAPTQVQELVVPGQGFGLGRITQGTGRFRAAIHRNFASDVAPDGPEKLYISRSALGLGKGGLLGEERLEKHLQAEGYEVFHPQRHDMRTQIARYKAARTLVAADGSALHLFAMVGRPDQRVAMILRRKGGAQNLLISNVAHFCGSEPVMIEALRTEWVTKAKQKSNRLSFGELDHGVLGAALAEGGFIRPDANWPTMTDDERMALYAEKGLLENSRFIESPEYVRKRVRAVRQARRAARSG